MSEAGLSIAIKNAAKPSVLLRPIDLQGIPPTLVKREPAPRRTKVWEFNTNLHCSIIGTCVSSADLRQIVKKCGMACQDCTDHELHGIAVTLAGRHDDAARQLHKALDHRHKLAINQFTKAQSEAAVTAMWRDAVRRGDIPGAYWATLTHPLTTQAIIREAFGEVHMLSHLVGSANRADIRRLCVLEADKAALEARLQRQQQALHEAVTTRDMQISDLRKALTQQIVGEIHDNSATLRGLIADFERRLAAEARRRTTAEERLVAMQTDAAREHAARLNAEREAAAMRQELDAIEKSILPRGSDDGTQDNPSEPDLNGRVILYVGGRPNQIAQMRGAVEQRNATFLHHDGGVENHPNLLPGLGSRADVVLFPVDCISHEAAITIKSFCRQAGKRFIPLRSASMTSLLAALPAVRLSDADHHVGGLDHSRR